MALVRITPGHYESAHFTMCDPQEVRHEGKRGLYYTILARTEEGRTVLPKPTRPLPGKEARATVAKLERQIAHAGATIGTLPAQLETGADLIALREALFPGVSITEGRRSLAAYLSMEVDHVRHMETGNRPLMPRTATMLKWLAADALRKSRKVLRAEERANQPFAALYEALSTEDA